MGKSQVGKARKQEEAQLRPPGCTGVEAKSFRTMLIPSLRKLLASTVEDEEEEIYLYTLPWISYVLGWG